MIKRCCALGVLGILGWFAINKPVTNHVLLSCATQQADDDVTLTKPVDLKFESATIGAVLAELSKQSGLTIMPAESIAERRVSVFLSGVSASRALDTITALNDWTWRRAEPHRFLVSRHTARRPVRASLVPPAMARSLPRDFRDFLQLTDWYDKDPNWRRLHPNRGANVATSAEGQAREALLRLLAAQLRAKGSVAYAGLTHEERELLLCTILFHQFRRVSEVLFDEFMPQQMDPERVVLETDRDHPEVLMVNLHVPEVNGVTGFGGGMPRD